MFKIRTLLLAGTLLALAPATALAQDGEPRETTVEDIVVMGMPLRDQVETFVDTITAPPPRRGPARWNPRSRVCVGVVNLRADAAQAMIDRVSQVALNLGLRVGEPGCSPNIVIIATDEADALAAAMVERSPNAFRPRYSGAARSARQLQRFVTSDHPVRWWHVSMPVHSETGRPAVSLPGQGPALVRQIGSRLTTLVRNDLLRAYVIIDMEQAEGLSFQQLADYVAMISFAQVDPDAELGNFPTILNVFKNPHIASGMTDWDQAYLGSLYGSEMNQRLPNAQNGAVASMMYRDRRRAERQAERESQD